MKGIAKIIAMAALWMALPGFAEDAAPDVPQDYAWGMHLKSEGASPFWQIALPTQVYEQSVWPDFRDVRVFNSKGEAVPFALTLHQQRPKPAPEPVALNVFPLDIKHVKYEGQNSLTVKMPGGAEVHLDGDDTSRISQSFLMTLPDEQKSSLAVAQLRLGWVKLAQNWQAKVDLYSSADLKKWQLLVEDAPLMDLTSGSSQLRHDTLQAGVTLSDEGPRYLLMTVFDAPENINVQSVEAIASAADLSNANIYLSAHKESAEASVAIYSWVNPQPLTALAINPGKENEVLPVEIDYRRRADDLWLPLQKTVLYRVSEMQSEPVTLNGEMVQAIRIKGINASWGDTPPEVQGLRASQALVFIPQGTGPFMLTWGNKAAKPQAMALDMVIPEKLRGQYTLDSLPVATEADTVTLGGEARLTAVDPAERRSQWMTMLIWGVLVIGVLGLLGVAYRLWREVKNKP
ncbi:DUF3999 family protein [Atlantibacter sp.]|uniref:DUF3999 family protein n=1 Tax=Atlantibacter sp. TaxID=1903473 RepID=UPI0028AAA29B|nr:DUF3999 family protein [Atlantibacter sp.]